MAKARVRLLACTAGGGPGKVWDECCKGVFILLSSLFNFYCLIFGSTEYCCTCAAVVSIAIVTYSDFWYSNGWGFVYYQKVMHIYFPPFLETYIFSNAKMVCKFSVEEFVQTSSLGEYKRRLHILFAFHGEISTGASMGSYSRWDQNLISTVCFV